MIQFRISVCMLPQKGLTRSHPEPAVSSFMLKKQMTSVIWFSPFQYLYLYQICANHIPSVAVSASVLSV